MNLYDDDISLWQGKHRTYYKHRLMQNITL
jgi:hypothetical protein